VTRPDFEIDASLRAEKLVTRVPPDAQAEAETEDVKLERRQTRRGVSERVHPLARDGGVAVEKRVVGRLVVMETESGRM
jgi:hypothetical protein